MNLQSRPVLALAALLVSVTACGSQQGGGDGQPDSVQADRQSMRGTQSMPGTDSADLDDYATAYFASGCFWCVEAVFESVRGVKEAVSGYSGGDQDMPSYGEVSSGTTGHAESVKVYYDPDVVSYKTLVAVYYGSQDPTTYGQAPDLGSQYRSIIFYQNDEEREIAQAYKDSLSASGAYSDSIVTEIVPFKRFWPAEDYHQNYVRNHPDNSYVRNVSIPRLREFQSSHAELLKSDRGD